MKRRFFISLLAALVAALGALALFTGCDKAEELIKPDAPTNIVFDPEVNKVSWAFVKDATGYSVSFDGGEASEVHSNSVSYTPDGDEFTFAITAKGALADSDTVTVTFVRLDSELTLTVADDGKITWSEVDGATGYKVLIDGVTEIAAPTAEFADIQSGAAHSVRVKPVRSGAEGIVYYAVWSSPVTVNKLGAADVKSIAYDDGVITWKAVASAAKYKVVVSGEPYETDTNRLEYAADGESFTVEVRALGNHESTFDGEPSQEKSFVYLDAVSGVTVSDGVLVWNAVDGATGYKLRLYDNAVTVTSAAAEYSGLAAGTQYNIKIMPYAEAENVAYFSEWTAPFSAYILPAPQPKWTAGFDADGSAAVNAINWDSVSQAAGYRSRVTLPDGNVEENALGATTNFYSSAFAEAGEYKVEIKATADGTAGIFDSKYATPVTVKRLAAPTVTNSNVTSTANKLADGFTVSFDRVDGATGYKLYRDGTAEQTTITTQFKVSRPVADDVVRETDIAYYIQSTGSVSADGKRVLLNSTGDAASAASAFNVKVLAAPSAPTIDGYIYTFTGTDKAVGYNVSIGGSNFDSSTARYDLSALSAGTFEVKTCAKGNGGTVLASNYTTAITVTRLNAPYGLRISTDESDGVLDFKGDDRAQSYQAIITGRAEPLAVDTTTNVKEYITTTATIVYMHSVANYFADAQRTTYYMTSQPSGNYTFFKLEKPDKINFSDTAMSWNAPSNLNAAAAFTPSYKISDGATGVVYNGAFTGTAYPLTGISVGAHSFGIRAIGDGEHYVNSDVAYSREITKLETPTLRINADSARYEWSAVAGASGYVLNIDGKAVSNELHEAGGAYYYMPTYETIGRHEVKLYATGDGGNTAVNSDDCEYTQTVKQLATPEFAYSYGAAAYDPSAAVTVTVNNPSDYALGYCYVIGGKTEFSSSAEFSTVPNTSGKLDMYVYAKGGGFDESEAYYIDSRAAATVTLTLLGYPSKDTFEVSVDGIVKWGRVDGARGYEYVLQITTVSGANVTVTGSVRTNTSQLNLNGLTTDDGATLAYADIRTLTIKLAAAGTLAADTPVSANGSVTSATVEKSWTSDLH